MEDAQKWTMPAFCWLLVFYLVLQDVPELDITMATAARDVFSDRSFDEAQATVAALLARDQAAWEEILGKSGDSETDKILLSLSRWETPDLSAFDPRPFRQQWSFASFRRPLTRPE